MSELTAWDSFYVIVGSAAGALIGLQFVVMTLIAERPPVGAEMAGAAFSTPSIVHFSVVLLLSALLHAPWQTIAAVAVLCGLTGCSGIAYMILVAWRMRVQTAYKPVCEDWLFHALLPLMAYLILTVSAYAALLHSHDAMFGIGGAVLLLLFTGIHNTWDAVVYHVFVSSNKDRKP